MKSFIISSLIFSNKKNKKINEKNYITILAILQSVFSFKLSQKDSLCEILSTLNFSFNVLDRGRPLSTNQHYKLIL